MKFDVRYKGVDHSEALDQYVEEKFSKLSKYEIRPSLVHVTFSSAKHTRYADVYIKGFHAPFRAQGTGENYYEAVDIVLNKVKRQMEREKSRIKKHKWREAA